MVRGYQLLSQALVNEHVDIGNMAVSVAFSLSLIEDGKAPLPERLKADLLRFVFAAEGHLAFENGLILPIAHQRLTLHDRHIIEQDFRLRRGMILPSAARNMPLPLAALTH